VDLDHYPRVGRNAVTDGTCWKSVSAFKRTSKNIKEHQEESYRGIVDFSEIAIIQ